MNKLLPLITIISIGTILSLACPDVFRWGITTDENICIAYDSSSSTKETVVYNINTCPPNHYCMFNIGLYDREDTKCKEKNKSRELVDGMPCQEDWQCYTKTCTNGKCKGKAKGEKCVNVLQCATGLTCLNLHCESLIAIGEQCNSHYDCVLGAYCHRQTKQCKAIYSLDDGEESENFQFCKSGETAVIDGKEICVSLTLISEPECKRLNDYCVYTAKGKRDQIGEVRYRCQCSHAYSDKTFCPIPLNDPIPQAFIKKLKEMKDVHTYNREILKTPEDRELALRALVDFKDLDDRIMRMLVELPYDYYESEFDKLIQTAKDVFFLQ